MTASKMLTIISRVFQRNNFQQTAIISAKMEKIKIMQWNCRGLSNKISELLVFLKEKYIQTACLNEVQSWHNENLTGDYFVVTETRASKSHGSMILSKRGTTIIEVCRNGKLNLSVFSEKNQINTDLDLFPTRKQILKLKLYKDNNGEEIYTDENG